MPTYPSTPRASNRHPATMRPLGQPNSGPPPQTLQVPNTPIAVSLAAGTGSNIIVTWAPPPTDSTHSAATGFNLQSSPAGAGTWTTVLGVASPYNLSGLEAGAAINVQLQSGNAAGSSAWSPPSTLTTATAVPYAPNAVSLAQGAGSNVTVTWAAPPIDGTHGAATGFNLQSSLAGANNWTTVSGITSPYNLTGMAAGTAINVQVESSNAAGLSPWSAITVFTTAVAASYVPNTPSAASLTQGTGSNLNVSWTVPAIDSTHGAATGFNLRSSPSGAGTWTTAVGVASPYALSGLAAGAAIDVELQSSNASGTSGWSVVSTLSTATAAPNTPGGVTLAHGTGSNLTVTWIAPTIDGSHDAATGFNLRSSPSGAGTWTTVSGVTSPYSLSGLAAGAAFDVQVEGSNTAGTSAWSATSTLTTATAAPNTPAAASLAQGTGSNLTVTWIAPAVDSTHNAAAGYNLRSSPSGANTWTTVSAVTSPYTLSGLAAVAAIDVQVEASNAAGTSAWSTTSTLTTAAIPYIPNTPGAASLAQGSGSNLTVTWTAPAIDSTHNAATGYNLQSSPSGAGTWTAVAGVSSPYTLAGLAGSAAIDVQLQSFDATGTSAWSATSTLTTAAAVFIPNVPSAASLAQGTSSNLTVTWTTPAADSTHGSATGFNLRSSPSGAGTWTTVTGVTSPYTLAGLAGASAIDVQIQSSDAIGASAWSATSTLTTGTAITYPPNAPAMTGVAPVPNGTVTQLTVAWAVSAIDGTHGAATGYDLEYSVHAANSWTTVTSVASPYTITGLASGTSYDVQLRGKNAATTSPSAWSASTTASTYSTVMSWNTVTTPVVHNSGGNVFNLHTTPNPSGTVGVNFDWSTSATTNTMTAPSPTQSLGSGGYPINTNEWGGYVTAPATAGTYYLWGLVNDNSGALVSAAITVT